MVGFDFSPKIIFFFVFFKHEPTVCPLFAFINSLPMIGNSSANIVFNTNFHELSINYPLIVFVMAVYDIFMDNYMGYSWELYVFMLFAGQLQ